MSIAEEALDDVLYEVVDGQIVEKPAMGVYASWIVSLLQSALGPFAIERQLGTVVSEMLFVIDRERNLQRRPDVAFVSYARWARDRRVPQTRSWAVAPDLAAEIISISNTADEVAEKLEEYFKVGVRLVWVVYPRQMKVYVYASPTKVQVLALDDELEGGDVLPGFRLALRTLFEQPDEPV